MQETTDKASCDTDELVTYYNGACPICSTEIAHYRRRDAGGLAWRDIASDDDALREIGATRDEAKKRLHARLPDGRIVTGVDAFIELWRRLPGFGRLAAIVAHPLVKPVANVVYDRILAPFLFAWNRRQGR
jgi:predicted DCC family thiol-disulfide oxidoreductase YuxK